MLENASGRLERFPQLQCNASVRPNQEAWRCPICALVGSSRSETVDWTESSYCKESFKMLLNVSKCFKMLQHPWRDEIPKKELDGACAYSVYVVPAAAWPATITALKPQELWPTAEQSKLQFKLLQNASTSLNMLENASSSISSSLRLPFPPLLTLSLCLLPLRLLFPERLQLNRAFETTPQGVCLSLCRGSA